MVRREMDDEKFFSRVTDEFQDRQRVTMERATDKIQTTHFVCPSCELEGGMALLMFGSIGQDAAVQCVDCGKKFTVELQSIADEEDERDGGQDGESDV